MRKAALVIMEVQSTHVAVDHVLGWQRAFAPVAGTWCRLGTSVHRVPVGPNVGPNSSHVWLHLVVLELVPSGTDNVVQFSPADGA